MPRIYVCHWCGVRGTKQDASIVVSSFTDQAYCTDKKACDRRRRAAARRAKALEAKEAS